MGQKIIWPGVNGGGHEQAQTSLAGKLGRTLTIGSNIVGELKVKLINSQRFL